MKVVWATKNDACRKSLIQLITWLIDSRENTEFLVRSYNQVKLNKNRKAMFVKDGGRISLFVDRVAK